MARRIALSILVLLATISPVAAQGMRYDLGRKFIAFETTWDAHNTPADRKRALPPLKKVMAAFFGGREDEVGRLLDQARHALESDQPVPDPVRWADSVVLRLWPRLVDPKDPKWKISLGRLYDSEVSVPAKASARLQLIGSDGKPLGKPSTFDIIALPANAELQIDPKSEGECRLRAEILVDEKVLATSDCGVTLIPNLAVRTESLFEIARSRPEPRASTEDKTLVQLCRLLSSLKTGVVSETDYPAAKFLSDAEELSKLPTGNLYFDKNRSGQFWMTLATAKGDAQIRIQVPPGLKDSQPVPLVIAMHGAGGSENMFFDAYGHGEIARQAAQRGWIVVTTRTEGFFGAPPVAAIVDELAKRYPIDSKRIFAIGHSMGAGQVVGLAANAPDRWRGLVCLGGAGSFKNPARAKDIPFFIGVGSDDFALGGARSLAKSLKDAGSEKVKFVEYPDIEHIAVVQVALPEVFKWFDELAK